MNPFEKIEKEKKDFLKEAPKAEVKPVVSEPENKPVQAEKKEMTNFVIHSELDALVMDRVKSQPKTLVEVDSEVVISPKEGRHALSLPDEIQPFTQKYAFTWIFKRKQAIDEACDMYHYKFTNRTYFDMLPDHLFSARGVIERGDMILMFRPKAMDEQMRKAPGLESTERIKSKYKAHEGDPNFYVPKSEGDEGRIVAV